MCKSWFFCCCIYKCIWSKSNLPRYEVVMGDNIIAHVNICEIYKRDLFLNVAILTVHQFKESSKASICMLLVSYSQQTANKMLFKLQRGEDASPFFSWLQYETLQRRGRIRQDRRNNRTFCERYFSFCSNLNTFPLYFTWI